MQGTNEMIMSAVPQVTTEQAEAMNNGEMVETSASTLGNVLGNSPSYVASQYYSKPKQQVREYKKVHRNDPCPCGSGKKYKHCCLDSGKYERLVDKN